MNAPAILQLTLNILRSGHTWKPCLVYLDDVIVYSESFDQQRKDVDNILRTLQRARVPLKLKKCDFFKEAVKYLGTIRKQGQLAIDETRIKRLKDMQHPRNITKLRSFLRICNLYRRFMLGYTNIATPRSKLLRKEKSKNPNPFWGRRGSGVRPTY